MRTTKRQIRESVPTTDDMRYDLAEAEAMNMSVSQIIDMLIDGFEGLGMIDDAEIKEEWNELFNEENKS